MNILTYIYGSYIWHPSKFYSGRGEEIYISQTLVAIEYVAYIDVVRWMGKGEGGVSETLYQ